MPIIKLCENLFIPAQTVRRDLGRVHVQLQHYLPGNLGCSARYFNAPEMPHGCIAGGCTNTHKNGVRLHKCGPPDTKKHSENAI